MEASYRVQGFGVQGRYLFLSGSESVSVRKSWGIDEG